MTPPCDRAHTVQFRRSGIHFFKKGTVVLHNSPMEKLQEATSACLYIYNQNIGQRGSTMHQYAVPQEFFHVKSPTTRTHHIYSTAPEYASLPISYIDNTNNFTTSDITLAVR